MKPYEARCSAPTNSPRNEELEIIEGSILRAHKDRMAHLLRNGAGGAKMRA